MEMEYILKNYKGRDYGIELLLDVEFSSGETYDGNYEVECDKLEVLQNDDGLDNKELTDYISNDLNIMRDIYERWCC